MTETKMTKNGFQRLRNMKQSEWENQFVPDGKKMCPRCHRVHLLPEFTIQRIKKESKMCSRCRKQISTCTGKYEKEQRKILCSVCDKHFWNIKRHLKSENHKHVKSLLEKQRADGDKGAVSDDIEGNQAQTNQQK